MLLESKTIDWMIGVVTIVDVPEEEIVVVIGSDVRFEVSVPEVVVVRDVELHPHSKSDRAIEANKKNILLRMV